MIEISGGRIRRRDKRIWFVMLGVFAAVFLFTFLSSYHKATNDDVNAASLDNFDPGFIISDWQMSNYNSMSEAEIQAFLTAKNPCSNTDYNTYVWQKNAYPNINWHFENGHFICISEERFGDGEVIGSGDTAAHIIWQAAQDYKINPKVIIVLLQKEQGLITDSWPNDRQYRSATGYGCPDTAPCSSQYYGFKNQVRKAAALFRTVLDGGWTNYPLGNNYIQYNPNAGCGGSVVNIRSLATSALYRYTPYQPNAGALAAGYGTAPCGAYGNRNFYLYYQDWFGGITDEVAREAETEIREKYERFKGRLGNPVGTIDCSLKDGACKQEYANGAIIYSQNNGTFETYGEIYNRYKALDSYNGILGFPITGINCDNKLNCYQIFEGSTLLGDSNYKTWFSDASVARKYIEMASTLGAPVANAECTLTGCIQRFRNGILTR